MLKNRKVQIIGTAVLIIAAILVTLSAVRPPASVLIPVTGINPEGLAQYQRSERSAYVENPKGLAIYQQSEHMQAYSAKNASTQSTSNEAGLTQYHRSEWGAFGATQTGLDIYHQSEWFGK